MHMLEVMVVRDGTVKKLIRDYSSTEHAHASLELEGYKVICIKHLHKTFAKQLKNKNKLL